MAAALPEVAIRLARDPRLGLGHRFDLPHAGAVVPVVLDQAFPALLLPDGQREPLFQPVAQDPDRLADVAGRRLLGHGVANGRQVVGNSRRCSTRAKV